MRARRVCSCISACLSVCSRVFVPVYVHACACLHACGLLVLEIYFCIFVACGSTIALHGVSSCSGLIREIIWSVILKMQNNKMKKLTEHIHALEEKLQNAFNENAKLRVKQKEDEKLWKGLESKFTSTKTLCDQLTETLQHLAGQVHDGRFSFFIFFFLTLGLVINLFGYSLEW